MKQFLLAVILCLAAGCSSLGLEQPKSLDDNLAYVHSTLQGLEKSAATALTSGMISVETAQKTLKDGDEIEAALTAAQAAEGAGDLTTAQGKLAFAQSLLTALQSYLNNLGVQ